MRASQHRPPVVGSDGGKHTASPRHGSGSEAQPATSWKDFISGHKYVLAGTDFFNVEVRSWRGLVTDYVSFFTHLESRRVDEAGMT
jgi:hypothetical protein